MTNFKLIWLVTRRELKERMQARSFLIILAFTVLLSGGAVVAIDVLPGVFEEEPKRLGLTNAVENALELELIESADALGVTVDTRRYGDRSAGEAALQEGEVDALLLGDVNLLFKSKEDTALHAVVDAALYARSLPGRLEELGLTLEDVRPLIEPEGVAVALLDPKDAGEAAASEDRRLVAAVAVMILYLALVLYGERLLNGVIEEKSSRVVEVLPGGVAARAPSRGKGPGHRPRRDDPALFRADRSRRRAGFRRCRSDSFDCVGRCPHLLPLLRLGPALLQLSVRDCRCDGRPSVGSFISSDASRPGPTRTVLPLLGRDTG